MKFIKQTRIDNDGNCLAACIASLLEIGDIATFPILRDNEGEIEWWDITLNKWLLKNYGHEIVTIKFGEGNSLPQSVIIAVGKGKESKDSHAVLWQDGKVLFDPSPYEWEGIQEPDYFILLIKNYNKEG